MLDRVLEPEAMDTAEEAREYDAMDFSAVNRSFVDDFLAAHGPCRGGEILDVGTGTARIPITLAGIDPNARVLAIDLAGEMLGVAARNVEVAGLGGRIRLMHGDAKALGLADGAFEAVLCNSLVHHVPDPMPALAELARLVAPGGTMFVRDLARPSSDAAVIALVDAHAAGESPAARSLFDASLRAALTVGELSAIAGRLGLPSEGIEMTSDRHWTWAWRRPG